MRIVFMGTPDFAVAVLNAIAAAGHEIAACVTQEDKPVGRRAVLTAPAVKRRAQELGIPVLQPKKLREEGFLEQLREIAPDVIVVAAYGRIIPPDILSLPPHGCLNVHASLLPKYRGAAPIQWALIDGEQVTGVTIMQMDEGLDTGDMLAKREVAIDAQETGGSLFDKLAKAGGELLAEMLVRIEKEGSVTGEPQEAESPTAYARMIRKEDGRIDWTMSAEEIERRVRAFDPWPGAWTTWNGKTVKVWKAQRGHSTLQPSSGEKKGQTAHGRGAAEIFAPDAASLFVNTGEGELELLEIQLEGKKRMAVPEFLKGNHMEPGTVLGG